MDCPSILKLFTTVPISGNWQITAICLLSVPTAPCRPTTNLVVTFWSLGGVFPQPHIVVHCIVKWSNTVTSSNSIHMANLAIILASVFMRVLLSCLNTLVDDEYSIPTTPCLPAWQKLLKMQDLFYSVRRFCEAVR